MSAFVLTLTADPEAPGHARYALREHLGRLTEDQCADVMVMVSELVSNVVQHGAEPARLEAAVSATALRIEVFDSGRDIPVEPTELPSPFHGGGRGLYIVAALATTWGIEAAGSGPGKAVWFELQIETGAPFSAA